MRLFALFLLVIVVFQPNDCIVRSFRAQSILHREASRSLSLPSVIHIIPLYSTATNRKGNRGKNYQTSICAIKDSERSSSSSSSDVSSIIPAPAEALAMLNEAKALRAQASQLQNELCRAKEERIRKEREKVDNLIDALLFHGTATASSSKDGTAPGEKEETQKQQLLHTEAQVAELLIRKRLNYDQVNQMFDRICELSNRPQSIDSCSPLLSLLLDAACQVDCLEREDNPNKRWNHRVERDLRRKLFALGYGIRIEDVERENKVRSITGEKDYN